ncbi:MAG: metallophosphoesterase [Candidatus Heimdallarchaeota archaeon]|nr:metallophosphoesterase [Candidatus Heimdallarchaeota archaeon]
MRSVPDIQQILKQLLTNPKETIIDGLSEMVMLDILKSVIQTCGPLPVVQKLNENFRDTVIVGDLHGDIESMASLVSKFMDEEIQSLIFLGDYVDRGAESMRVLLLAFALKLAFPERICILKGNHEDINVNKRYGFYNDVTAFFHNGSEMMDKIDEAFNFLSVVAITPNGSMCVHGGISEKIHFLQELDEMKKPYFSLIERKEELKEKQEEYKVPLVQKSEPMGPNIGSISSKTEGGMSFGPGGPIAVKRENEIDLNSLKKAPKISREEKKLNPLYQALYEMQWNDPKVDMNGFGESKRGKTAATFGEDALNEFLDCNDLNRLIRAHEYSRGPYQKVFGRLIHIFSSGPYKEGHEEALYVHETSEKTKIINNKLEVIYDVD